ncbi:hypothetical protein R3P38DRAFT_2470551, partial [Favolaschia claudopus]
SFAADSGATVHLSPVRDDFYSIRAIPAQKIWGVGGTYIEAIGKGDIHIRHTTGAVFVLKDALYVPKA